MLENKMYGDDKRYRKIIWFCCILYTLSVVCKGIYASSLVEVVNTMRITKAEAGYAITAYYITYAIGQIVFGKLTHKGRPSIKIGISLMGSAVLLVCFALCNSLVLMIIIWGVHGVVQAVMWPNIIELQARYLPDKHIENGAIIIASGLALATVFSYILSSLSVLIYSWTITFYFIAGLSLVGGIFSAKFFKNFLDRTQKYERIQSENVTQKKTDGVNKNIIFMLIFEIVMIVVISYIRHSVTNWLPNMISEVFSVASYFSIILTVVAALLSVFGSILAKILHKYIDNYILIIVLSNILSLGIILLLRFFYADSMVLSVILSSLVVMFSACINVTLVSVIPLKMRDVVDSGNFSAIMNAFASIAVAFATTLSGAIIDSNDGNNWLSFYDFGLIFLGINLVVAIVASVFWKKKIVKMLNESDGVEN